MGQTLSVIPYDMKPGKNEKHFEYLLKQAQVMVKEMKYQSAISILRSLVLLPISAILKEDNTPYSTKKLFCGIFCEAFAILTELSCQFEYSKELNERLLFLMQQRHVGELFQNKNLDVFLKLRFASACADVADSSFARISPKSLMPNLPGFDTAKEIFASSFTLKKEYSMCFVKIMTVHSITSYLRQNFDDYKILEAEQVVPLETVWKQWKAVGFPEEHLLIIICVGCLVMEDLRSRNALVSTDFLEDFSRLTARALTLRMYLVVAIIPYSDVIYHCGNSKYWKKMFFLGILEAIETSWDLTESDLKIQHNLVILLLQFFGDAITDSFICLRALDLYKRCVGFLFNYQPSSESYLEIMCHLLCVCLQWMDVDLMEQLIETADDTTGLLELYRAVAWMLKGELAEQNKDKNEAAQCFDTAEKCFQKYIPDHDFLRMSYHFWLAIFSRSFGQTHKAIDNLLISITYEYTSFHLSCLEIYFLPQPLKKIINDFKRRGCRNDVNIPSRIVIGSVLVTYYITLGRSDDAKREALELWDEVRRSFKFDISFSDALFMSGTSQVVSTTALVGEHDDETLNRIDHLLGLCQYQGHPVNLPPLVSSADCIRSVMATDNPDYFRRKGELLQFFMDDLVKHGDEILKKSMMTSGESTMLDLIRHFVNAKTDPPPRRQKSLYYIISGHALNEAGFEEMAEEAFARSIILNKL